MNYFMTSLRGKKEVQVKFENSMHNYNATLVTLGYHCSTSGSSAVHKVKPLKQIKHYRRTDGNRHCIGYVTRLKNVP